MKIKNSAKRRLELGFILAAAAMLLVALITVVILEYFFNFFIPGGEDIDSGWYWILIFVTTSVFLGLLLAALISRIFFRPVNTIIDGMTKLSGGDFSTRIDLGKYDGMRKLASEFNLLASELENTEILRSDFINDFSHELKTPIVSLSGLISLMKNENLTEDKRQHYLAIMEEETDRLTKMTSDALYFSKIKTQNILTNKKKYNLSEQIRNCVLLLQEKWEKKQLELSLDFDEYTVIANEDMLKQVFFNLIDNAIKFSYRKTALGISIEEQKESYVIEISDTGAVIPESEYELIFNKFYRGEKNTDAEGNGIGLSIVKHITQLHGGKISVKSDEERTVFTLVLPKG